MYWFEFFISAVIIIFAGIRLTVYADKLSDELKFGKIWVGIVLLGFVTSLPEAVTSLVSIISLGANDLAVGNLLGSNNINPMLIVVMDIMYRQGSLTNDIRPNPLYKLSARFSALLALIVIADIVLIAAFPSFHVGPVSVGGILIAFFYFIGMRNIARLSKAQSVISPSKDRTARQNMSVTRIWIELSVNAILVIVGAIWLAKSADVIAVQTGLGRTFVGSIFLALITSLPELVVSLSALKLGSLDLAIGNIFGSNMTNMFIMFFCGLFQRGGHLLEAVSKTHIVTAVLSILLTYVAVKGIYVKNKKTVLGVGWDSLIMIVLFMVGTGILYRLRSL